MKTFLTKLFFSTLILSFFHIVIYGHSITLSYEYALTDVNELEGSFDSNSGHSTLCTSICTSEYNPVWFNGKEFSNGGKASSNGYTSNEWLQGPWEDPNVTSLVFDIENNICGIVGQIVTIPVKVKGFTKVSSFQFTVSLADTTKGEITSIEKGSIEGDLNFGLISPATATLIWDNTAELDLADSTVVLNVKVRIKTLFEGVSDINILGSPTELLAIQNQNDVKPTVIKGSYCARSFFKICGKITREDNVAVPSVIVSLSGGKTASATTNASGEYCFENLDANLNYVIKPSKNTNHVNGVNTGDVTAIRRHILALEKLNSPYKIIAADASKSNVVNTGDVTEIRRLILALISQFTTTESWAFVPKSHTFVDPANPFAASIPNSISVTNLNADLSDLNFTGIKIGDVNLSNNASNISDKVENRSAADINLIVGSANVTGNQNFDIDITVKQFRDITNGQFSLNWNTNYITFSSLKNMNPTLGITNDNYNSTLVSTGKLGFIWDSPSAVTIPDNTKLFTISFKTKSQGAANVNITDDPVSKYFENKDKQEVNVVISNGSVTVPTEEQNKFDVLKIYPNPTTGLIYLETNLENVRNLEIRSVDGQLLSSLWDVKNNKLDLSHLPTGSYMLRVTTSKDSFTKKVVIVR